MKQRLIFIAIIFVLALVAVIVSSFLKKPAPKIVPVQTKNQVGFKDLRPGLSKQEDATKTLGQPLREEKEASGAALSFSSGLGNRTINILVNQSKTILLVVEPIAPDIAFTGLASSLGEPDAVLYGDYARLGFSLSVYLSSGTAILANPATGEVKERWYFAPMTLEQFKTGLAPGYQGQPIHEGE